jgi:hypothetical protein
MINASTYIQIFVFFVVVFNKLEYLVICGWVFLKLCVTFICMQGHRTDGLLQNDTHNSNLKVFTHIAMAHF